MKRFICLLLSLILIFPLSIFGMASSEELVKYDVAIDCELDYSVESNSISSSAKKYFYKSSVGSGPYTSYSLLTNLQQEIYDNVVNAGIGKLTIAMSFDKGDFPVKDFNGDFFAEIMNAIALDNPQIFYYAGSSITNAYTYSGGKYIAKFNYNVTMFSNSTYAANSLVSYHNAMMNVMKNAPIDTSNRYNFVRSVHDFLCEIGTYPDLNSSDYTGNSHDAYGCLVEGKPVCQGYADAFKLFCDYYKIPCVNIGGVANGGNHMWNAVQMDDGYWYLIDITWDDQELYGTFYDFFLSGTDTRSSIVFGNEVFKDTHINDSELYIPNLPYAIDKYQEVNHNTAFNATYNILTKNEDKLLTRCFTDIEHNFLYYNGMYVDATSLTTGDKFVVPSGPDETNEEWTLVLLGDCNADGSLDAMDYSLTINKILADEAVDDPYDMAADVINDGYLDVLDAAMMHLLVSGLRDTVELE